MAKYKLLAKRFLHRKETKTEGAIIESGRDLVKIFGKEVFELMPAPAPAVTIPPVTIITESPKAPTKPVIPETVVVPNPSPVPEAKAPISPSVEEEESEDELIDITEIESNLGKNVTKKFECAMQSTLCVFQSGIRYYVTKPENPGKALNKKFLNKTAVDDFIDLLEKE